MYSVLAKKKSEQMHFESMDAFAVEKARLERGDTGNKIGELIPGRLNLFDVGADTKSEKSRLALKRHPDRRKEKLSHSVVEFKDYKKLGMLDNLKKPKPGIPIPEDPSSEESG